MRTLAKLLYVEADEEITDLVDRLRDLSLEEEVTFVVPERARALQSAMSFRLLKRYADSYGKRVNVVSSDPRLQALSLETGFPAYPTLAAYDTGSEVDRPERIEAPERPNPAPATGVATAVPSAEANRSVATLAQPRQTTVTSAPPTRKPPPAPLTEERPPLRSYRPYLIGAGIIALLALLFGMLYLPTAAATLTVQGTPIKDDVTLLGAPGTPAGSANAFATQAVHASESQTLPGTPTGQKQIAAIAATGNVTFTLSCFLCDGADLPKGLVVSTDSGLRYATQQAASISGTSGTATVPIAAVTPGAAGNTAADTITTIEGNTRPQDLRVDNHSPTTGGAEARTANVIQQSDIDSVRDVYAKDAVTRVTDQLNSKAQGLHLVLVGNGVQAVATADHKVGEEVPGFTITITVSGDGVAFDDKTVKAMLRSDLQNRVPQGSQLTPNNITTTYDAVSPTADGHITLNGHAAGFYTPVFLVTAIRSHLKGMSPSSAHAFLQSLPSVVDARVVQQPYGLPWLPLFSSRITLNIQEVSGSGSSS